MVCEMLVDRDYQALPLSRQCELLGIPRSSLYYQPLALADDDKQMMRQIDELYTKYPFYGSRRIAKVLSRELKVTINRKRIQRLMQIMDIEAIYPKPNLSQNNAWHVKYPYLLKGLNITAPNQVWGTDITYIRLQHGFAYLVAYIDWYSRLALAWRLSTTLETGFTERPHQSLDYRTPNEMHFAALINKNKKSGLPARPGTARTDRYVRLKVFLIYPHYCLDNGVHLSEQNDQKIFS